MAVKHLAELVVATKQLAVKKMVVVNGVDEHSIEAAEEARKLGVVDVILTGNAEKIQETCQKLNFKIDNFKVVDVPEAAAALKAIALINTGEADFIMKGLINTDKYMRVILNKENGLLKPGALLSHVAVFENSAYHKLLFVSDVAIIPYPTMAQKVTMSKYLIEVARRLGIEQPKVALIAPTEQVLDTIPACVDAAKIKQMALDGEFTGGIVDGPMAIDVALDRESAEIKNIQSEVAGDADCLLFPNIDAGNVFYKVNSKLCHSEQAAIVYGAKVPIVLSSRGDSAQTKLNSIVLAALMSR
ncbi:MAG TPA: phosphate acyltransferase [Sunxiuqinia sp.]|nr:phosphate acyltransferase [Sunxiuqinia sp.]